MTVFTLIINWNFYFSLLSRYISHTSISKYIFHLSQSHLPFTCSKAALETSKQCVNLFNVINKDNRATPYFLVNFEQISHIVLVFPISALKKWMRNLKLIAYFINLQKTWIYQNAFQTVGILKLYYQCDSGMVHVYKDQAWNYC